MRVGLGRVRVSIVALEDTDQRHSNVVVLVREDRNEGLQSPASLQMEEW